MNFYDLTLDKLKEFLKNNGENPAKAGIIFDGIYKRKMHGTDAEFPDFGFSGRAADKLSALTLDELKTVRRLENESAGKLLLELADGNFCETVLMRQRFGVCVCVSTQVGCNMGCKFCRSGRIKKRRSLTAGEITAQVTAIEREYGCKVYGVSVMGIGEPFDNFDAVRDFCEIVTEDKGLAVGRRHVTVSTCGIVPEIYRYADCAEPTGLAISLHAPNDALRNELMPINRKYPISEVLAAAEYYSEKTHKRVTLEYIMLGGVNDGENHASELAGLIAGRNFYVNLIPYNSTDCGFHESSSETISKFCAVLKENGVVATKRKEFGAELNAACGQLLSDYE